ncbi:MAG: DNA methyltransferase, partial [Minicystis sp.]
MPPSPERLLTALSIELRRALEGVTDSDAEGRTELGERAYAWAMRAFTRRCLAARDLDPALITVMDPTLEMTAWEPPSEARARCVALLSGEEQLKGEERATDEIFRGSDALGWAYQGWNTDEKNRLFEAMRIKKIAKVGGAAVIPATCIYTRAYLVKFLVQSSLGARYLADHPRAELPERWAFRLPHADPPPGPRRSVADLRFLDPACGSGHFLLEAFDLFHALYLDEGLITAPEAICASIFAHNLHGLDIDARAVQIAAASLRLRAWEIAPGFVPSRMNLLATGLDGASARAALEAFLADHPEHSSLRPLFAALDHTGELGALIRVASLEDDQGHPRDPVLNDALDRFAAHLEGRADTSAEEARGGLSLIALLGRRYDVVCMNPPYIGFRKLAPHLKERVAEDPLATLDLYVAFLSRFFAILREGGCLAAVTPSSWTTSSKTAKLRRKMLDEGGPRIVASLGQRVFDTAPLLFVSLSVIHRGPLDHGGSLLTLRAPSGSGEEGLLAAAQRGGKRWPHEVLRSLETLPFFPVAPLSLLERARDQPSVQDFFSFTDGVWTGSNDRDFREAWEVRVGDPRWVPASGGQGYARWYAPFARRMRARDGRVWSAYAARAFSLEYSRVAGGKLAARLVRSPSLAIAG